TIALRHSSAQSIFFRSTESRLPIIMRGLLASAIRLALPLLNIQLSKIDTTSRLPLGARLESARPRKLRRATYLIPESHRDRRESMICCRLAVYLLSDCCLFAVTFLGSYRVCPIDSFPCPYPYLHDSEQMAKIQIPM